VVRVKVCGITSLEDALVAVEAGAHALGFVFAPSLRQIDPETASRIISRLPPFVTRVGVFVDGPLARVKEVMAGCSLDLAQLHGEESPEYCQELFPRAVKAFRVRDDGVLSQLPLYRLAAYLLDSYVPGVAGGSGRTFDWEIALQARKFGPIILSGGLNPENVRQAIEKVQPYGVDVSTGVEKSPGKKDPAKLRAFFKAVREASLESPTG
jgi:phosphoribosylanthranilate isomerase